MHHAVPGGEGSSIGAVACVWMEWIVGSVEAGWGVSEYKSGLGLGLDLHFSVLVSVLQLQSGLGLALRLGLVL